MNALVQQSYKRFFKECDVEFNDDSEDDELLECKFSNLIDLTTYCVVPLAPTYFSLPNVALRHDAEFLSISHWALDSAVQVSEQLRLPGPVELEKLFKSLASEWREDTKVVSSMTAIITHPAYLRIIGLGPDVLSLVLRDLEATNAHWFVALKALTGENPVPTEAAGRVKAMATAWLNWGKAQGYLDDMLVIA